jgi:hypothetical protein
VQRPTIQIGDGPNRAQPWGSPLLYYVYTTAAQDPFPRIMTLRFLIFFSHTPEMSNTWTHGIWRAQTRWASSSHLSSLSSRSGITLKISETPLTRQKHRFLTARLRWPTAPSWHNKDWNLAEVKVKFNFKNFSFQNANSPFTRWGA